MRTKQLPIGYWLKQADELLTKRIDDIQSSFGITRKDWQILNTISENNLIPKSNLMDLMSPFADAKSVNDILLKLRVKDLIEEQDEKLALTAKGKQLHLTCLHEQKRFRQTAMTGVSEQDYEVTISTLQKIVANIAEN